MSNIKNILVLVATAGGLLLALSLNHFYEGKNIFADKHAQSANTAFNKRGDADAYRPQLPLRRNNPSSLSQSTTRGRNTPNAEKSLLRLKDYLKHIEERNEGLKVNSRRVCVI